MRNSGDALLGWRQKTGVWMEIGKESDYQDHGFLLLSLGGMWNVECGNLGPAADEMFFPWRACAGGLVMCGETGVWG